MSKSKPPVDLLAGDIPNTLKRMTVPMIMGMVLLMTFNIVDTFFVGMLGTEPLAAISFTFPITFTVISLAIGLGIGTSAIIAKALGAGNVDEAKSDGTCSLLLSFILVGLLSTAGYFLIEPLFTALGATPALLPLIHSYMEVWFFGSVFLITPMIGNSVLRASGDTKTPSIIMALGGAMNAILDPILIFGFGPVPAMGIQGAAIASVIAWTIGFCIIIYILAVKKELIHKLPPRPRVFAPIAAKIMKIGMPAAGANMLTPAAMAILTAIIATYGKEAVAAFGVGSRIESLASLVVLALSMTLPPFISQNFGAGKMERVEQAYKKTLKFVLAWQLVVYILLVTLAGVIANIFTDDPNVISIIKLFIYILPLGYGLQGVIILSNSSFNALHKPMNALLLSIVRLFIFYVPFAYLGGYFYDIQGLFIGALIGNVCTAMIAYKWFMTQFKQQAEANPQLNSEV
ncbi:MATE family efflux transporter [Flocculibacter collagenilyticus]|uniref:MATE family efflux transporter n=1 Tax=Flocculibacter collagenilyticus TaxID=2744479 RepID=UPI001F2380BA|nr:MATE family efflux transporter [Flocculibacter collagenilyticus]